MDERYQHAANQLESLGITAPEQTRSVAAYRSLGLFSLHNEIRLLMYVSVLLFTGGAGILIYDNIDSVGHTILLILLLLATVGCFVFAFRQAPEFSPKETDFPNPAYNYLVLTGTLLGGIFINYLEYQYHPFGVDFAWPALITAVFSFFVAYRFDSRPALTIGITALATAIGIKATPQSVFQNDLSQDSPLIYSGIVLGLLLAVVAYLSGQKHLKKHFVPVYDTFALHLVSIGALAGMCGNFWPLYAVPLALACFWYWRIGHQQGSTAIFAFVLLYAFLGVNLLVGRFIVAIGMDDSGFVNFLLFLSPAYFIGAITLFIIAVRKFYRQHS